MRLHVVEAGPPGGRPLLLLHGFPESWIGWRRQIEPLAARGYRVWVPDQRGYGRSDKPRAVAAYALEHLVADARALVEQIDGDGDVTLVGHDWGAAVGWTLATAPPSRLARLVVVNVPHPAAMLRALTTSPRQMLRSWYILFFQIPWLPERLLSARRYAFTRAMIERSARPGAFGADDWPLYHEAWGQPRALTSMLAWYRAAARRRPAAPGRVALPTRILWGARDTALRPELAEASLEWCEDAEVLMRDDATHWIQHEHPDWVVDRIDEFARSTSDDGRRRAARR